MRSDRSDRSTREGRLRPAGGYRTCASFQTATLIYDATYWFCEKFLDPRSRLVDQMVQAARSGRQNIAEASRASAASSQTELRLLNVARASLEELLLDFEDYLRHHRLPQWAPDSPGSAGRARSAPQLPAGSARSGGSVRSVRSAGSDRSLRSTALGAYAPWLEHADPAVRANAVICLIHQANFLLDRQISALEKQFIEEGGYSERLAAARLAFRRRKDLPDPSNPSDPPDPTDRIPNCPRCGKPMVLRTARSGRKAGSQFWGCSDYPKCEGAVEL